jgi:hypothetical protein
MLVHDQTHGLASNEAGPFIRVPFLRDRGHPRRFRLARPAHRRPFRSNEPVMLSRTSSSYGTCRAIALAPQSFAPQHVPTLPSSSACYVVPRTSAISRHSTGPAHKMLAATPSVGYMPREDTGVLGCPLQVAILSGTGIARKVDDARVAVSEAPIRGIRTQRRPVGAEWLPQRSAGVLRSHREAERVSYNGRASFRRESIFQHV